MIRSRASARTVEILTLARGASALRRKRKKRA